MTAAGGSRQQGAKRRRNECDPAYALLGGEVGGGAFVEELEVAGLEGH